VKSVFLFIVFIVLNTYSFKLSEKSKISLHISLTASITYTSCMSLRRMNKKLSIESRCLIGSGVSMGIGIGKEFYDLNKGFDFSGFDVGCDAIGTGLAFLLYYAIHKKLESEIYDGYFLIEGIDKYRKSKRKDKRKSILEFRYYIRNIFNKIKSDSSYGLSDLNYYDIQLMIIVDQYLKKHLEQRNLSADLIIKLALTEIFSPEKYKGLISE